MSALDEAWAAAEAALPGRDWLMEVVHRGAVKGDINPHTGYPVLAPTLRYTATAAPAWRYLPGGIDPPEYETEGDTPTAALEALAAKLEAAHTVGASLRDESAYFRAREDEAGTWLDETEPELREAFGK